MTTLQFKKNKLSIRHNIRFIIRMNMYFSNDIINKIDIDETVIKFQWYCDSLICHQQVFDLL